MKRRIAIRKLDRFYGKKAMKRVFLFVSLFGLLFSACDDSNDDPCAGQYRLKKIEFIDDFEYENSNIETEYYGYFPDGNLFALTREGLGDGSKKRYYYKDGQLSKILHYTSAIEEDGWIMQMDSFEYLSNNRLKEVTKFSYKENGTVWFQWRTEYYYYNNGLLRDQLHFEEQPISYYSGKNVFHWEDGNIVHIQNFRSDGKLKSEEKYEYDDHPNYLLGIPTTYWESDYLSQNNWVQMEWSEYLIYADWECGQPCPKIITYNECGYPIEIVQGSDKKVIYYDRLIEE